MAKYLSSFQRDLQSTRIIFDPSRMLPLDAAQFYDVGALGALWRLLPYLVTGHGFTVKQMANIASVPLPKFKKYWDEMRRLFVESENGTFKLGDDIPWLQVQKVVARPNVRHFMERLVDFWGNACAYCGREAAELEIDHIVPRSKGGSDDLTNLTLACGPCNRKKHARTAEEFGYPHIHEMAARIQ